MFFGLQVVFVGTSFEFLHISNPHMYVFGSWNKGKFYKPLFRVQLNFNILNSILCVAFLSYLKNYNIKPRYQEEVTFSLRLAMLVKKNLSKIQLFTEWLQELKAAVRHSLVRHRCSTLCRHCRAYKDSYWLVEVGKGLNNK